MACGAKSGRKTTFQPDNYTAFRTLVYIADNLSYVNSIGKEYSNKEVGMSLISDQNRVTKTTFLHSEQMYLEEQQTFHDDSLAQCQIAVYQESLFPVFPGSTERFDRRANVFGGYADCVC